MIDVNPSFGEYEDEYTGGSDIDEDRGKDIAMDKQLVNGLMKDAYDIGKKEGLKRIREYQVMILECVDKIDSLQKYDDVDECFSKWYDKVIDFIISFSKDM